MPTAKVVLPSPVGPINARCLPASQASANHRRKISHGTPTIELRADSLSCGWVIGTVRGSEERLDQYVNLRAVLLSEFLFPLLCLFNLRPCHFKPDSKRFLESRNKYRCQMLATL